MKAFFPWLLVVIALIWIAARTRDGWLLAIALAILVAALVALGMLPSL